MKIDIKREINEELVDVWAVMLSEKIENLKKSQESFDEIMHYHPVDSENYKRAAHNYAICEAKISALISSVTLLNCLENGRYKNKYNEIVNQLQKEYKKEEFSLIKEFQKLGFGKYICTSFEEAEQSKNRKNLVIIDDKDIYLTYTDQFGNFGEIISFKEDEYLENKFDRSSLWIRMFFGKNNVDIDYEISTNKLNFEKYDIKINYKDFEEKEINE